MTDRELMQQALNVLKIFVDGGNSAWARKIIEIKEALRDRLAQPEEPDWSAAGFSKPPTHSEAWWKHEVSNAWAEGYEKGRLQREFKGLTEAETIELALDAFALLDFPVEARLQLQNELVIAMNTPDSRMMMFAALIEAKLKDKNGY